jgi:hypothetical protein
MIGGQEMTVGDWCWVWLHTPLSFWPHVWLRRQIKIGVVSSNSPECSNIPECLSDMLACANRQAFWLTDHSTGRAFPGRTDMIHTRNETQWLQPDCAKTFTIRLRRSSPNTAMAGLRWILTIFPFNGAGTRSVDTVHLFDPNILNHTVVFCQQMVD